MKANTLLRTEPHNARHSEEPDSTLRSFPSRRCAGPSPLWLCVLLFACLSLFGCGADSSSDPNNGGKTNWLSACEEDSECGTLNCVIQVCTEECESTSECEQFGSGATCATLSGSETRACLAECDEDSDCQSIGEDLSCEGGRCVAEASCEGDDCPCQGTDCEAEYDACEDKACGEPCEPCAPGDEDCADNDEVYECNGNGECDDFVSETERCSSADCQDRDPEDCGDYCTTLSASPVGLNPREDTTALGCDAGELACGEAETCALDDAGACWRFSNTCLPLGFVELGCGDARCCEGDECTGEYDPCAGTACGDACQECAPNDPDCDETDVEKACNADGECQSGPVVCENPSCDGVDADSCEDEGCGTITGTPAPENPATEPTALGCLEPDTGCDDAITCALDGDGECWRFSNGCTPAGFEQVTCFQAACCEEDECDEVMPYDPCDGKSCGDDCQLCAPGAEDCTETAVEKYCNPEGECEAIVPECSDVSGCDGPSECADDEFCYKETCAEAGECRPMDEAGCDGNFLPVCGCDGMTYSNACEAAVAGAGVASEGECAVADGCESSDDCAGTEVCFKTSCEDPGTCQEEGGCLAVYDPVCGCDGATYGNSCTAASASIGTDYIGECADDLAIGEMWRTATVSFGLCAGDCRFNMTRSTTDPVQVLFEVCDNLGTTCRQEVMLQLNEAGLRQLQSAQDQLRMVTLEDVYGCPDCADGGATAFTIEAESGESSHSYEFRNPPDELTELDAFLMDMYDSMLACEDGAYYTIVGECNVE